MKELSEIIGGDMAAVFIATFGGQIVSVPKCMHPAHKIAIVIGFDAALKLSTRWSGETITVPRNCTKIRHDRNLSIRSDRRTGMRLNDLSQKHQLTTRQISKILQPPKL